MLQCSKYKPQQGFSGATIGPALVKRFNATFTKSRSLLRRWRAGARYLHMGYCAGAQDLRNLLSVAAKLRLLADDTLCRGDRSLYLMTAEALETRAQWLAAALPPEEHETISEPQAHLPVDLTI